MTVPRVIYQTWKTKDVPEHLVSLNEEWKKWCLKYKYNLELFDDDDLRKQIKKYHPKHLKFYDSITANIERVDFARYSILHSHGGVYADLDTAPLKPIESLMNLNKIVLGKEPDEHVKLYKNQKEILCNAFMISPPNQDLWEELMISIKKNYKPYGKPVYNTGPMAITRLKNQKPELFANVVIMDSCAFYPLCDPKFGGKVQGRWKNVSKRCNMNEAFIYHEWGHEWCEGFDAAFTDPTWWFLAIMLIVGLVLCFPLR